MRIARTICAVMIRAASLSATEVSVETLGIAGEREKKGAAELHVFGGQPAELELAVEAPLGSKVSLGVALFQITSGLAAPLGAESAGEPLGFEQTTRRIIRVPVSLPEVKRRSEMVVRFRTQIGAEKDRAGAGHTRLFVYPKDHVKELAVSLDRLEKDAGVSLAVFGESKRLRAFLKESGITFADSGTELPSELRKTALYIGEVDPHSVATRRTTESRIIFFSPNAALLPGVYTTIREPGLFTKVTLPILDTLATNPQSQRAFIDILRHSLDASALTPADSP